MEILDQAFYLKDGITLAKELLGQVLVRQEGDNTYAFKIVETEAYMGITDKGAHVFGDKKTARTAPLYEIGGTTYIYLIYGMYHCLNISAGEKGVPYCVLIRSVEPMDESAVAYAAQHRNIKSKKLTDLTNGPGKLCKALHIDRSLNHLNVSQKGALWIAKGDKVTDIVSAKRINIPYAQEDADKPWRFYIKDHPFVSIIEK